MPNFKKILCELVRHFLQ